MLKCRLHIVLILTYILMLLTIFKLHNELLNKKSKQQNFELFSSNRNLLTSSKAKFFGNSSKCKSMFTVNGDASLIGYRWQEIARKLKLFRMGVTIAINDVLYDIARFLPIIYKVKRQQNTYIKDKIDFDYITDKTSVSKWPFLPCEAHLYKNEEVTKCAKLLYEKSGEPLRISFMGDSMTRSIMQQLVFMLHNNASHKCLYSNKTDIFSEFHKSKIKENVVINGCGLDLRLYWASYLERNRSQTDVMNQGARDVLEDWAFNKRNVESDPIPDILLISSGLWHGSFESGEQALEEIFFMIKDIYPMLKAISSHTRIIWHMQPLLIEAEGDTILDNGVAQMMNQIAHFFLQNSNIWLWNSLSIIHTREKITCINLMNAGIFTPETWRCRDAHHPGEIARKAGTNMIWNLVCNKILNITGNKCC